jgi:uncharacterized protein (DUF983 family)
MTQPSIAIGLWRGFTGHCPNCGKGPILHRYLKVTSPCPVCGHDNAQYPSDDAPPYFTILIVGHIVIPAMLILQREQDPPTWVMSVIFLPLTFFLALGLLRPIKGGTVGLMLRLNMLKSDADGP